MTAVKTASPQDVTTETTKEQTTQPTEKMFTQKEVEHIVSERINKANAKKQEDIKLVEEKALKELETSKSRLELIKDLSDEDLKKYQTLKNMSDSNAVSQVSTSFVPPTAETKAEEPKYKIDISNI